MVERFGLKTLNKQLSIYRKFRKSLNDVDIYQSQEKSYYDIALSHAKARDYRKQGQRIASRSIDTNEEYRGKTKGSVLLASPSLNSFILPVEDKPENETGLDALDVSSVASDESILPPSTTVASDSKEDFVIHTEAEDIPHEMDTFISLHHYADILHSWIKTTSKFKSRHKVYAQEMKRSTILAESQAIFVESFEKESLRNFSHTFTQIGMLDVLPVQALHLPETKSNVYLKISYALEVRKCDDRRSLL